MIEKGLLVVLICGSTVSIIALWLVIDFYIFRRNKAKARERRKYLSDDKRTKPRSRMAVPYSNDAKKIFNTSRIYDRRRSSVPTPEMTKRGSLLKVMDTFIDKKKDKKEKATDINTATENGSLTSEKEFRKENQNPEEIEKDELKQKLRNLPNLSGNKIFPEDTPKSKRISLQPAYLEVIKEDSARPTVAN